MRSVYSPRETKILPSEFLSAIVHELKTPLSAIISFSEFLKNDLKNQKSAEECADYVQEINIAATEMNELVHDLLEVKTSYDSGNFSVDLSKEINLTDVVKRSVKLNYDYSLKRSVNVQTQIATNLKPIKLDPKRIKQILTNLISNSIKYSPSGSEVKIVAENNNDNLVIAVTDQGFGMRKKQIKAAFEKYQTIENPNSGSVDSFGMGLPIVKQLVELQNGIIEVDSKLNEGTKITLKFPL